MKDKEWLKGLINEEGIVMDMHLLGRHDEQYWKNENIKINKGRLFYLIDQLEEPEVLSQKWIDENVVEGDFRGGQQFWYGRFIEEEKVRNLLVPKQEKPEQTGMNVGLSKVVIPQFIADWYEENLSGDYTNSRNKFSGNDVFRIIQDVLETSEGFKVFENYGIYKEIATWAEKNEETFIHLIANCSYKDGYEVDKEKLYIIKFAPSIYGTPTYGSIGTQNGKKIMQTVYCSQEGIIPNQYTKKEIEEVDGKYMIFAEEVTE